MRELRSLHFETLDEAADEARRLLASGYVRHGNWSLGQICRHLVLVQNRSIDGYPAWTLLLAPLRPLMRRKLLPKLLHPASHRGIKTIPIFIPPESLDDAAEVEAFSASVDRLINHTGEFCPHPAFGRLDREEVLGIQRAHAAHHLSFLSTPEKPA